MALNFRYQWLRDGVIINEATSPNYVITSADQGHTLTFEVSGSNGYGTTVAVSVPFNIPGSVLPTLPVNTVAPAITSATVGIASITSNGTWTGTAPIGYTYQWYINAAPVGGATSNSYTPVSGDNGKTLYCIVTATNTAGTANAQSNSLTVASGGSIINIPDVATLNATLAAWPTSGNAIWQFATGDYGSLGIYNYDFRTAPVILRGQSDPTLVTINDFGTNSSGMTWENMTVNGTNVSPSIQIDDNTLIPPVLTFTNFRTDSGDAMGTQTARGWDITCPTLVGGSITINGADDVTKPDVWGRIDVMVLHGVQLGGGTVNINGVTYRNFQTNGIIGGGAQNVAINRCYCSDGFDTPGGHPNAIHFFSSGPLDTTNLTVTNCGIQRGNNGLGFTGIFLENCDTVFLQNNWVYVDTQTNNFSNAGGSNQTNDNNFGIAFTSTGFGGAMTSRGGAANTTCTNNTISFLNNVAGPNPGYIPAVPPGSNTIIGAATTYGDYTALDTWLAAHPTARARTA